MYLLEQSCGKARLPAAPGLALGQVCSGKGRSSGEQGSRAGDGEGTGEYLVTAARKRVCLSLSRCRAEKGCLPPVSALWEVPPALRT